MGHWAMRIGLALAGCVVTVLVSTGVGTAGVAFAQVQVAAPDHRAPVLNVPTPGPASSPSVTASPVVTPAGKARPPWWVYIAYIAVALAAVLGTSALARRLRERRDARSKQ